MPRRPVVDPRFPARLRELRELKGISLRALAKQTLSSSSHIHQFEHGAAQPSIETAQRLDDALGAGGELAALVRVPVPVGTRGRDQTAGPDARPSGPLVEQLRRALVTRRAPDDLALVEAGPRAVQRQARYAHDAYQRSDYTAAAKTLPATLAAGEQQVRHLSGQAVMEAHRALAVANVAASKLIAKMGDGALAWMTADRAISSAVAIEDRPLAAVAAYQVACAMLRLPGRLGDAQDVIGRAIDELTGRPVQVTQAELSARGALLLLGAIVAGRAGDRGSAAAMLAEADKLATMLDEDRNDLWSGFGPTNVAIHRVSVAVELARPDEAVEYGDRVDTSGLPAALVGRRAQVHLDLAAAFAQLRSDPVAVLHLLEAERIAPQVIQVNHAARQLLADLLSHERRVATPGLRALAVRAGILAE